MIPIFIYVFFAVIVMLAIVFTYPFFLKIHFESDLYSIYLKVELGLSRDLLYFKVYSKASKTRFFNEGKKAKDIFDLLEAFVKSEPSAPKKKKGKGKVNEILKAVLKERHTLYRLNWKTSFGTKDPVSTALSFPAVWTFKSLVVSKLLSSMMCKDVRRTVTLSVVPTFDSLHACTSFCCIVRLVPGYIILKDVVNIMRRGSKK